jgi:hypothetical protein
LRARDRFPQQHEGAEDEPQDFEKYLEQDFHD